MRHAIGAGSKMSDGRHFESARRYIRHLQREGRLDVTEARAQLEAVDEAARSGKHVLVVADVNARDVSDQHVVRRRRLPAA